ncbi:hypothetical protein THAOC_08523, partial [Thalassiosira oceanica]
PPAVPRPVRDRQPRPGRLRLRPTVRRPLLVRAVRRPDEGAGGGRVGLRPERGGVDEGRQEEEVVRLGQARGDGRGASPGVDAAGFGGPGPEGDGGGEEREEGPEEGGGGRREGKEQSSEAEEAPAGVGHVVVGFELVVQLVVVVVLRRQEEEVEEGQVEASQLPDRRGRLRTGSRGRRPAETGGDGRAGGRAAAGPEDSRPARVGARVRRLLVPDQPYGRGRRRRRVRRVPRRTRRGGLRDAPGGVRPSAGDTGRARGGEGRVASRRVPRVRTGGELDGRLLVHRRRVRIVGRAVLLSAPGIIAVGSRRSVSAEVGRSHGQREPDPGGDGGAYPAGAQREHDVGHRRIVPVEVPRARERQHHPLAERGQEEEGRRDQPRSLPDEEADADDDDAQPDEARDRGEDPEHPADFLHGREVPVDREGLALVVHDVVDVGALLARCGGAVDHPVGVQAEKHTDTDDLSPFSVWDGMAVAETSVDEVAAADGVRVEEGRDEAREQEQDRQPAVGVQAAYEEARVRVGLVLVVRVYEGGVGESKRDPVHVPELRGVSGVESGRDGTERNSTREARNLLLYWTKRRAGIGVVKSTVVRVYEVNYSPGHVQLHHVHAFAILGRPLGTELLQSRVERRVLRYRVVRPEDHGIADLEEPVRARPPQVEEEVDLRDLDAAEDVEE